MLRWSLATALISAALVSGTAAAEISRGCRANVLVHTGNSSALVAQVEGRGFCKNRFHANECRERARDAIATCMQDLWAQREQNALPPSCTIIGSGRPFAILSWASSGLRLFRNSLNHQTGWQVCCRLGRHGQPPYFLQVSIQGDHGCTRDFPLSDGAFARCNMIRMHNCPPV